MTYFFGLKSFNFKICQIEKIKTKEGIFSIWRNFGIQGFQAKKIRQISLKTHFQANIYWFLAWNPWITKLRQIEKIWRKEGWVIFFQLFREDGGYIQTVIFFITEHFIEVLIALYQAPSCGSFYLQVWNALVYWFTTAAHFAHFLDSWTKVHLKLLWSVR